VKIYRDLQQGSGDWFAARLGIPTASNFDSIITPKTMKLSEARKKYACRLIAERLMNRPTESVEGQQWMERGKELEPLAVQQYEFVHEVTTSPVGFVTDNLGTMGASPDRVVFDGDRIARTLEIKCPSLPVHLEYLMYGPGDAYRCQIQGQLWICEADKGSFYSYFERGPAVLLETARDEVFIKAMTEHMETFQMELIRLHERALELGIWQAFAEVVTPIEAEEADNLADRNPDDDIEILARGLFADGNFA
jgi:YqaJ-like viral recombinase domain